MVRSIGAQVGLLAFGIAVLAGIWAGNSAFTILWRALLVMAGTFLLGQLAGWIGKLVLRDHLQQKKLAIEQEHLAALRGPEPPAAADPAAPAGGG
jgi:hypothetical protein